MNLMLLFLLFGCVVPATMTHECGSSDPSSEWDCAVLDDRRTTIGQVVDTRVLELMQTEDVAITIANSEYTRCLKEREPCSKSAGMVSRRWW